MKPWELRQRRKDAGVTQEAFGALIGCCARSLSLYEQGKTRMPRAIAISAEAILTQLENGTLQLTTLNKPIDTPKRGPLAAWIRKMVNLYL